MKWARGALRDTAVPGGVLLRGALVACATVLMSAASAPAHTLAAQDEAMAIMLEAERTYEPIRTLCADFVHQRSVPILRREYPEGRGRVCSARPNLFALRFTEPAGETVVLDGEWTWIYRPSTDPDQVLRTPVEPGAGGTDFFREFLQDPATKYDATLEGTEEISGASTFRLRLEPKVPTGYRVAWVWIDRESGLLRQVRYQEEDRSERLFTLHDLEVDVTPPAGFFTFEPPAGASVISR